MPKSAYLAVVGYQTIEIPGNSAWSLFCVTFDKVGGEQSVTLADIKVVDENGAEWDSTHAAGINGKLTVRKLAEGTVLKAPTGWAYTTAAKWGANATKTLTSGEGLVVQNRMTTPVYFQVSGEVILKPVYGIPGNSAWSIWGNNTPVDITLGDIKVFDGDGKEWDSTHAAGINGKLTARKLADGTVLKAPTGWAYTTAAKWGANATQPLAAGEALIIQNRMTESVYFHVKGPLDDK